MNQELLHAISKMMDQKFAIVYDKLIDSEQKINVLSHQVNGDVTATLRNMDTKLDCIKKDVEFTYQKASMNELENDRLKRK